MYKYGFGVTREMPERNSRNYQEWISIRHVRVSLITRDIVILTWTISRPRLSGQIELPDLPQSFSPTPKRPQKSRPGTSQTFSTGSRASSSCSYSTQSPSPLLGPLLGRCLPIFTEFSDFLGRLQPSKTTTRKTPDTLGVEESSYPRRVLHF